MNVENAVKSFNKENNRWEYCIEGLGVVASNNTENALEITFDLYKKQWKDTLVDNNQIKQHFIPVVFRIKVSNFELTREKISVGKIYKGQLEYINGIMKTSIWFQAPTGQYCVINSEDVEFI